MLVMWKSLHVPEMRRVIIAKHQFVLFVLKMIAVSKMDGLSTLAQQGFVQFKHATVGKTDAYVEIEAGERNDFFFKALNMAVLQSPNCLLHNSRVAKQRFMQSHGSGLFPNRASEQESDGNRSPK